MNELKRWIEWTKDGQEINEMQSISCYRFCTHLKLFPLIQDHLFKQPSWFIALLIFILILIALPISFLSMAVVVWISILKELDECIPFMQDLLTVWKSINIGSWCSRKSKYQILFVCSLININLSAHWKWIFKKQWKFCLYR